MDHDDNWWVAKGSNNYTMVKSDYSQLSLRCLDMSLHHSPKKIVKLFFLEKVI